MVVVVVVPKVFERIKGFLIAYEANIDFSGESTLFSPG